MEKSDQARQDGGRGAPQRQLSLFDSASIIVGIIIGSGLYQTTPLIAASVGSSTWLFGVWIVGGLFALVGSLCYAELATAYPLEGGDYVFLSRAYGRPVGFLFAWAQLWVIRPGSIGAMAFVFASYAKQLPALADVGALTELHLAVGAVLVLGAVNMLGVREGKWTQNALTATKVAGLLAVFVAGMVLTPAAANHPPIERGEQDLYLAMILVLFTYGGWNDVAYVAAEVRDPNRNIVRALLTGTSLVTLIYLLVNAAFLHALGFDGFASSQAVAADVAELGVGAWGRRFVSGLICVSALGAINAMLFTGARIYYALGTEHRMFRPIGQWNARLDSPLRALALEMLITVGVMTGFAVGAPGGGFQKMIDFSMPLFWGFLLASGVGLLVLRVRDPDRPRPFRTPGYPLTPLLFCGGLTFMVYASVVYAAGQRSIEALWSVGLLAVGGALALVDARWR